MPDNADKQAWYNFAQPCQISNTEVLIAKLGLPKIINTLCSALSLAVCAPIQYQNFPFLRIENSRNLKWNWWTRFSTFPLHQSSVTFVSLLFSHGRNGKRSSLPTLPTKRFAPPASNSRRKTAISDVYSKVCFARPRRSIRRTYCTSTVTSYPLLQSERWLRVTFSALLEEGDFTKLKMGKKFLFEKIASGWVSFESSWEGFFKYHILSACDMQKGRSWMRVIRKREKALQMQLPCGKLQKIGGERDWLRIRLCVNPTFA